MADLSPLPPARFNDIFLQPGEFYFGDHNTRIRTLLGSCVAITLWHPRLKIGGMCHYLLPTPGKNHISLPPDGRYANGAVALFMQELENNGSRPSEYQVKMFGGGNQFTPGKINRIHIPNNNIDVGKELLKRHGFTITAEHLGGTGHRNVIFELWSGRAWIHYVAWQGNGKCQPSCQ